MTISEALARAPRELPGALDDLARLIAIDTSLPPGGGYGAIVAAIEALLAPLGFASRRVVVPEALWRCDAFGLRGERVNLIAERASDRPRVFLYVHLDTVPPGPGWTTDPFVLTRRGACLHGRGTGDMKGTIASILIALRAAAATGLALARAPVFLGCTDEEGGTYPGLRYLAEQDLLGAGTMLCLNGGAVPRIYGGSFGSIDVLLRIAGASGHVAHGAPGFNAIEAAGKLLVALERLKLGVAARTTSRIPAPPGAPPLAARLTVATIGGGTKGSMIPSRCELVVNRRYAPEEDVDAVVAEIVDVASGALAGSGATLETVRGGHLIPVVDPDGPDTPRWAAAMAQGFGFAPGAMARYGSVSSSDMGFAQRAGIEQILLGGLARPDNFVHGADEFTTEADLVSLARALLIFMAES